MLAQPYGIVTEHAQIVRGIKRALDDLRIMLMHYVF